MLSVLLLLVSDPAAPVPPVLMTEVVPPSLTLNAGSDCANARLQRIAPAPSDPPQSQTDLMYRPDGSVRRYLLLERSIDGCSVPISYALPNIGGAVIVGPDRPAPGPAGPIPER